MSGIEGNYRTTCEIVMQVLRDNKESLMAVLEAFVYDPLMNWLIARKDRTRAKIHDGTSIKLKIAVADDLYRFGHYRRASRIDPANGTFN